MFLARVRKSFRNIQFGVFRLTLLRKSAQSAPNQCDARMRDSLEFRSFRFQAVKDRGVLVYLSRIV